MATPYMNLTLPTPGVTAGPDWGTMLNAAITTIDSHDHSNGKGTPVTPAGLNINADLSFQGMQATFLKTAAFSAQSGTLSSSFKAALYSTGGDLYWNNGSGTAVQITTAGTINVSSVNGISGLAAPASASFSTPDFVFKSAATTYGKIDCGDIKLFEASAGITNAVTLKSPAALAGSYSITMPTTTPAGSAFMLMDASGVLSTTVTNDATLSNLIGASMTSTGANAVANTRTRVVKTDGTDPGVGGVVFSAASGGFTTSSSSWVDVTNLSVSITTSGRPVLLALVPDGQPETGGHYATITSYSNSQQSITFLQFVRGGSTSLGAVQFCQTATNSGQVELFLPPSSLWQIDVPSAGLNTYKLQARKFTGSAQVYNVKLMAFEL